MQNDVHVRHYLSMAMAALPPHYQEIKVQAIASTISGTCPNTAQIKYRPAKRANRAGTRGFRAPEVLFKCQSQSTSSPPHESGVDVEIDIWSCGVILLSFLSIRFPFFNSTDDVDAMIELTSIFGRPSMRACARLHSFHPPATNLANLLDCTFDATLSTVSDKAMSFEKVVRWVRPIPDSENLDRQTQLAFSFLELCMELDPKKRCSARGALDHPFLAEAEEDQFLDDDVVLANTEEQTSKTMDALEVLIVADGGRLEVKPSAF
jgi:serine/threonine protein kinase